MIKNVNKGDKKMNKEELIQKLEEELTDYGGVSYRLVWNQDKGEYIITIWL